MFAGMREAERLRTTVVAVTALLIVTTWLSVPSFQTPRDFEDCTELARGMSPGAQRTTRVLDCGARFAGRRKIGGGYTYYDLWQNRSFDIAGPNPTADERTRIYAGYMRFLASRRREEALAEVDRMASEQPQAETSLDFHPLITKRRKVNPCIFKGSLSCTWAKFKSAVGNAFASTPKQEVQTR
jgi:hypothetical protein